MLDFATSISRRDNVSFDCFYGPNNKAVLYREYLMLRFVNILLWPSLVWLIIAVIIIIVCSYFTYNYFCDDCSEFMDCGDCLDCFNCLDCPDCCCCSRCRCKRGSKSEVNRRSTSANRTNILYSTCRRSDTDTIFTASCLVLYY